ncbi:hypothetical protein [Pseudidiomarina terrestris]|uniref:hypothetical protein n=1 Tax=Pseudidiomarina terrestris TaxID=2820060 RepID=UPI002653A3F7|nr:hypothetical protein [Pseudidiomarina sp. 1ASP75-5]MDN7136019.1 hypothetical protein [Pseudidiomarina sp. 1ASP75-5]
MWSFIVTLLVVASFTILAKFGVVKFELLQEEKLARNSFVFFLYAYLLVTGFLAASSYERRSYFRTFVKSFSGIVEAIYLSCSGSLVGWSLGLTVYVALIGEWGSLALGLVLTSYMLLYALAPIWYHEQILSQKNKMTGFIFTQPRFSQLFQILGWVFIVAALVGFYDFFSA